jgi:hypothetical protein
MTMLIVAGCSNATRENNTMKDAFGELMKRPSSTTVKADYQKMLQTIQDRLIAEVGVATWVPNPEPISGSFCGGDLSNLEGSGETYLDTGVSIGNLPDAQWERAVAIVAEVAGARGFGAPKVIVDSPSDHEVSFRSKYNGSLLFGTGGGTILSVRTGCLLTQEAHQRGTYLPPKVY